MKKNISLLSLIALLCLAVTGCGNTDNNVAATDEGVQQDVLDNGTKDNEQDLATDDTEAETTDENIAIKSQELVSFNGLTVTMKDVTYENLYNEGIDVIIENKSDVDYIVSSELLALNDYTCSVTFRAEVPAGEKLEKSIAILYGQPDFYTAEEIGQVSLYITVRESLLANVVYESGEILLKTSKYDEIQIEKMDNGDLIYDGVDIKVVSLCLTKDAENNYKLKLFVENNRNEPIAIKCNLARVNGNDIEVLYNQYVSPMKMNVGELSFYSSDMAANGITDIEELEIYFEIRNNDSRELIDNSDIISVPVVLAE